MAADGYLTRFKEIFARAAAQCETGQQNYYDKSGDLQLEVGLVTAMRSEPGTHVFNATGSIGRKRPYGGKRPALPGYSKKVACNLFTTSAS